MNPISIYSQDIDDDNDNDDVNLDIELKNEIINAQGQGGYCSIKIFLT